MGKEGSLGAEDERRARSSSLKYQTNNHTASMNLSLNMRLPKRKSSGLPSFSQQQVKFRIYQEKLLGEKPTQKPVSQGTDELNGTREAQMGALGTSSSRCVFFLEMPPEVPHSATSIWWAEYSFLFQVPPSTPASRPQPNPSITSHWTTRMDPKTDPVASFDL